VEKSSPRTRRVGPVLDAFLERSDMLAAVRDDPVALVHAVRHPEDREVAALITALLAFGQVKAIQGKVREVLGALGPHPAERLSTASLRELRRWLAGFRYRWLREDDLVGLLAAIGATLRRHGSLEAAFAAVSGAADEDIGPALGAFSRGLWEGLPGAPTRGTRFLLPTPESGSACKRFCLFLRWVARPADGVDLGLWRSLPPAKLVIPLDTHIARIARYIGLTRRKSPGWGMALDVTRFLRRLSPEDPLRYDFALCHLGISGRCPKHRVKEICRECDLNEICKLPRRDPSHHVTAAAARGRRDIEA
jgi:uncharacterized protein (TIGR02757 family)